jgi:iron complex outermembrane receptor protein
VRDFNAIGEEAFLPRNETQQFALFTLQELALGPIGVELAGRYEHVSVSAPDQSYNRDFNLFSGAVGISHELGNGSKLGVNLSRVARAPSAEELLSDGPHIATQSYELGDPDFGVERGWSVEGYTKLRVGNARIDLSAYHSWFSNFIYATDSGLEEDGLPVYAYHQGGARYYGFEAEATMPVAQFGGFTLNADAVADYVRAKLNHGNGDLPRIPPLRLRGGLELTSQTLSLRGEVEWADDQTRIGAGETATDGFTLVNASASWKPMQGVTLILSGNNLFDVDARRHASFTKDFVPMAGRDIRVTARLSF